MGKSTISMAIFSSKLLVHQRVSWNRFLDSRTASWAATCTLDVASLEFVFNWYNLQPFRAVSVASKTVGKDMLQLWVSLKMLGTNTPNPMVSGPISPISVAQMLDGFSLKMGWSFVVSRGRSVVWRSVCVSDIWMKVNHVKTRFYINLYT